MKLRRKTKWLLLVLALIVIALIAFVLYFTHPTKVTPFMIDLMHMPPDSQKGYHI